MKVVIRSKDDIIELSSLKLSEFNPRYETVEKLDGGYLVDLIVKDCKVEEQTAVKKLYSWEGDLSDFLSLLQSIKDYGFQKEEGEIILVKVKDLYVVAEGNRRIWALKLITEALEWKFFENKYDNANEDPNDDPDQSFNLKNKLKNNSNKIEKILSDFKSEGCKDEMEVEVIVYDLSELKKSNDKSEKFFRLIYSRNLEGIQKRGKRPWGRGKYFTDLLLQNASGLSPDKLKTSSLLTGVEPEKLKRDYGYALFVRNIIDAGLEIKSNDGDWKRAMKQRSVTALQDNFSLKRIRTATFERLKVPEEKFKDEFFSFKKNTEQGEINYLPALNQMSIPQEKVLSFIWKWFNKKVITTRPVKSEHKEQFEYAVFRLLKNWEVDPEKITEKKLKQLNLWDLKEEELRVLYKRFDKYRNIKSVLEIKESFREVKTNYAEIKSNLIGKISAVFPRLLNQLCHNLTPFGTDNLFFNAAAVSIRSFFEQFLTWKYAFHYYKDKKEEFMTLWKRKGFSNLFKDAKKDLKTKNKKNEIFQNDEKIIQRFFEEKRDINEFIHESYKFYVIKVKEQPNGKMSRLDKWVKNLKNIVKEIESDKRLKDFMDNVDLEFK